jgi:hypothetical protein
MDKEKEKEKSIAVGCTFLLIIFIAIYIIWPSSSDPEKKDYKTELSKTVDAWILVENHVKKSLKSPGSAKFPFAASKDCVTKESDSTYFINCYVDSQNSFGALIRTYFQARVEFNSDGDYWMTEFNVID